MIRFEVVPIAFVAVLMCTAMRCGGSLSTPQGDADAAPSELIVLPLGSLSWLSQFGQTTHAPAVSVGYNGQIDYCSGIAVDADGNVYCAGATKSVFGEANASAFEDAFVMKMNSAGVVQWVTQLGLSTHAPSNPVAANAGSDFCNSVAIDSTGNVYCAGSTSGNLGEVNAGGSDAFVMKLNSAGIIQWVTQLGQTTHAATNPANVNQGSDICYGVGVDSSGNVYCGGVTSGNLSEVNSNPGQDDIFMMKLNSSGTVQWITQFGATTQSPSYSSGVHGAADKCYGIAVDAQGNVYCAGRSDSSFGESSAGGSDALVIKLNTSGVVQWVTQLGATTKAPSAPASPNQSPDQCNGVAVDAGGNVYCGGQTRSDMGESNAGNTDAFVLKLNSSGAVQWVTQFGASTHGSSLVSNANEGWDECLGVAVDTNRNVYCAGTTSGNFAEANGGASDAFVFKLDTDGALIGAMQFGSTTAVASYPLSATSGADSCNAIAVDTEQRAYCGGSTFSNLGEAHAGSGDAFILKLE